MRGIGGERVRIPVTKVEQSVYWNVVNNESTAQICQVNYVRRQVD